jgi:peptide/nickel transport system permease protein
LNNLLHGDLGTSFLTGRAVSTELFSRLPSTLLLVSLGILGATVWGLLLGASTVFSRGTSRVSRLLTSLGLAMPDFVLGVMLIFVFYFLLDWAPSPLGQIDLMSTKPPHVTGAALIDALLAGAWSTAMDAVRHLVLPVVTMALVYGASVAKVAESAFREARTATFMDYAGLSGLRRRTRAKYLTMSSLPPTITYSGASYAYMLGGVVLIETVFSWGGVAQYAASAIANRDLNVIQGFVLITSVVTFAIYLVLDILYIVVDPRVRT